MIEALAASASSRSVYFHPTSGLQEPVVSSGSTKDHGIQITVSEGHPFPPKKGEPLTDLGGDFYTTKQYVATPLIRRGATFRVFPFLPRRDIYRDHLYSGPIIPNVVTTNAYGVRSVLFPPTFESSKDVLNKEGTTAISRCKPTNSVADVSTFLGELLKDGLPSLIGHTFWKDKAKTSRKAGSEYLNVQFGWRPLVSDVQKFLNGVRNADAVLKQYERDSGRVVRRNFAFPEQVRTSEEVIQEGSATLPMSIPGVTAPWKGSAKSKLTRRREIRQRRWFSGAFTYHLPSGYDSRNKLDRYALLANRLGLTLTPETLWELAPWSWAVDWFSNAGDVLSNVSAFEQGGLIMRYGYIMEHTIVRDEYILEGITDLAGGILSVQPLTLVTETKKRQGANPYGFGVTWDGLSPFQVSIITALGLTKGRR